MKNTVKDNRLATNIIAVVVIIAAVALSFTLFYNVNERRISAQNETYISDITEQRAMLIRDLFSENTRYIDSAAMIFRTEFEKNGLNPAALNVKDDSNLDEEQVKIVGKVLKAYEGQFAFSYLRFIDLQGRDYTTEEEIIQANVSSREYFADAISGNSGITYIMDSKVTSERQVGFYSPVKMNGGVIGFVIGFYGEEFMNDILSMKMFGYDCEVLLCDKEGNVLYNTFGNENYSNFVKRLKDEKIATESELADVEEAFSLKKNNAFRYLEGDEQSAGCIVYLDDESELFLVMDFPVEAYTSMIRNSNINGIELLVALVFIFLALLVFYTLRFISQRKRIVAEAKNSNDIHTAMSSLFENFIIVDADTGRYDYIEGMPEVGEIPNVGDYETFVSSLLDRFRHEGERKAAEKLLSLDRIIDELNRGQDVLSYKLHAPIGKEEWFTYNFIAVTREMGKIKEFIIARQDITELQQKEEEIKETIEAARNEAERSSQAKSDFLSNMSHDIRTPMNAIIGYTNIAKSHMDESDTVGDSLDKISSSSKYLLSLINDILDMSKIESGKIQLSTGDCDLSEIFSRIADITRSQAEKKSLNISYDVDSMKHSLVVADELRFEQIMINIISNAIKYTPEGRDIFIGAKEEPAEDGKSRYTFSVKDTGVGISEDFLPHIFESFSREKNSRIDKIQGTGLGMAITARLVELMGGKISVESKLGEGSEFTVVLPLETRAEEAGQADGRSQHEDYEDYDIEGDRILLVEDNDVNAEIAMMVLEQFGITTERASDGKEGVDTISAKGEGYYKAVLMDIQMPVMNGYEATRAIRALEGEYFRNIPIIAMSANAYEEDVQNSIEAGMDTHVSKPFDPEELVKTLKKYIYGRSSKNA